MVQCHKSQWSLIADQVSHYVGPSIRSNHNENTLLLREGELGHPEVFKPTTMLYGYDTYYPPTEFAQPHADPYFAHPNSTAAQLGLTPEEIKEVVEEQERWFREEYQQELVDRARESTEHQEQQQHQDKVMWVPTPSISNSEPTPQAYGVPDEP